MNLDFTAPVPTRRRPGVQGHRGRRPHPHRRRRPGSGDPEEGLCQRRRGPARSSTGRPGSATPGFGLDIVDWIMEPGSDEAYRDQLPGDLPYVFNNLVPRQAAQAQHRGAADLHAGEGARRRAVITRQGLRRGRRRTTRYTLAAPGKKAGSQWEQTLVFPAGKRYFLSATGSPRSTPATPCSSASTCPATSSTQDGDTFSEVYLSYHGRIPASEFREDFAPDEKFLYVRERRQASRSGSSAPTTSATRRPARTAPGWPGMTLDPAGRLRGLVPPARLRLHDRGVRRPADQGRRVVRRGVHRRLLRLDRGDGTRSTTSTPATTAWKRAARAGS